MTSSTAKREPNDELTLEKLIKFISGEEPINGRWFGEHYEGEPIFWWRPVLKKLVQQDREQYAYEYADRVIDAGWGVEPHLKQHAIRNRNDQLRGKMG